MAVPEGGGEADKAAAIMNVWREQGKGWGEQGKRLERAKSTQEVRS